MRVLLPAQLHRLVAVENRQNLPWDILPDLVSLAHPLEVVNDVAETSRARGLATIVAPVIPVVARRVDWGIDVFRRGRRLIQLKIRFRNVPVERVELGRLNRTSCDTRSCR
jgi:hypothetical protein